ncbi:hypothetical protein SLS62_005591 [Diatrype stigma]|uniref:Suppressor of anucleate metulae protein B n=1 Tax=Diatrype stigma TaxID=117547 RepID=A0AAN9V2S0_9PEZI
MPSSIPPTLTLSKGPSTRGRGLLASRAFAPGDLIATFDDPLVVIPDSAQLPMTCSWCLSSPPPSPSAPRVTVHACKGCQTAAYCSTACQRADWRGVHKGECKVLKRARAESGLHSGLQLPTPVRALVRLLLLLRRNTAEEGTPPAEAQAQAAIDELQGHVAAFRGSGSGGSQRWRDMELQALGALHYMGMETVPSSVAGAVELLCKMQVNSFNRLDVDIGQSGLFLHPALAMVNHSCVPNAFVQFSGRRAILRAYRAIKEGEEVEISYIECTLHRSHRQQALKSGYHFDCICPRCSEDLDVYEVCQMYPHLELNLFSLTPNFEVLGKSPAQEPLRSNETLRRKVEKIYPRCSTALHGVDVPQRREELQRRWGLCKPLRKAKMFAIQPLTQAVVEACIYFGERGDFAAALAISCFVAIQVDPYRSPMPFDAQRVKGLLILARILTNTASGKFLPPMGSTKDAVKTKLSDILAKTDQLLICQVVLALVVRWGPSAHSDEWQVCSEARDLLENLKALSGREKEYAKVETFAKNPSGPDESIFFEAGVLRPIRELSDIALDIMTLEFGS